MGDRIHGIPLRRLLIFGPSASALAEVQEAVRRACQDTVTLDSGRSESFFIGDFNDDGSEDIAVVVKPATGALPKLNS